MSTSLIVPSNFGPLAPEFAQDELVDDLGAGITGGFGHIGYKGKVWSVRYRGSEITLMRPDGDGAMNSIPVVILKASTVLSKIWYEKGYVDGSNQAPDCFSANGVVPDAASTKKQSVTCATCPKNVWGTRVTDQGMSKGKACSDSKRLAVVPLDDLRNETFGGPLLLRVPPASLQDTSIYSSTMQKLGYPYYAIGTRIAFDTKEAYPKFVYSAIRPLDSTEARIVKEMRDDPMVTRILAETGDAIAGSVVAEPAGSPFEQQPEPVAQPAPPPQQQPLPNVVTMPQRQAPPAKPPEEPAPVAAQQAPQAAPQKTGFGGVGLVTQSPKTAPTGTPVAQNGALEAAPTGNDDFDAMLDQELAKLMPTPKAQ